MPAGDLVVLFEDLFFFLRREFCGVEAERWGGVCICKLWAHARRVHKGDGESFCVNSVEA